MKKVRSKKKELFQLVKMSLKDSFRYLRDYLLIKKSGDFDEDYYCHQIQDVNKKNKNPLMHFLRVGWKEGKNPSKWFNTNFYLEKNADVRNAGINPMVHYLRFGKSEGRITTPFEDDSKDFFPYSRIQTIMFKNSLLTNYEDLQDSMENVSNEWNSYSEREKSIINLLNKSNFFDSKWYLLQNNDVQELGIDPWTHFVRTGIHENRSPNRFFNPKWYSEFYTDVGNTKSSPLYHYLSHGLKDGRKGNPLFVINLLVVEHCNNKCQFCSTSSPYAALKFHDAESFFPWLDMLEENNIPFLGIAITGGEPFLHPDLEGFIKKIKHRYPAKLVGVTTNFFWANERAIRANAQIVKSLNMGLLISLYPKLIRNLGSKERFQELLFFLKKQCPETIIRVDDCSDFFSWDLKDNKQKVTGNCVTSDCFILRTDGKISHCSIGVGFENNPKYKQFTDFSKDILFDLKSGINGIIPWAYKYPFDLCSHCTMWRKVKVPWREIEDESTN